MPKKVFASPEEERQWRENRPEFLKAYNKAFKQRPEYKEWQKNYRSTPEFIEHHKAYMREYNKRKGVKAKQKSPGYKIRQHQNYLTRKKEGRIKRNPDWAKDPQVRERRNKARRDKRAKARAEREAMLALMTPREVKSFLSREKRLKKKKAKAAKIQKAFKKLEQQRQEAERKLAQAAQKREQERQEAKRYILEQRARSAEQAAIKAHKLAVDKLIQRVIEMRFTRAHRLAGFRILPMKVVGDRLRKYREVIDEIRGESLQEVA